MSVADELGKLSQLRETGGLSEAEFQAAKARILGTQAPPAVAVAAANAGGKPASGAVILLRVVGILIGLGLLLIGAGLLGMGLLNPAAHITDQGKMIGGGLIVAGGVLAFGNRRVRG